jgi:guanine nucleotide-binding protein subunit alpha
VYYFNSIDRMSAQNYLPTDQDILRSRVKTTGITETTFKVGELTYKLFDVGGQRSERKKWIHCFENVTALVFLVSLSEYDQMLYEDESVVCPSFSISFLIDAQFYLPESNARSFNPLRLHMQLKMVRQDFYRRFLPLLSSPRYLTLSSQILFLNKTYLFAEKLPSSPLGDYFPDFRGGDNYDASCEYLLHRWVFPLF